MFDYMRRVGRDPETVVRSKPGTFNAPLKWKENAHTIGSHPMPLCDECYSMDEIDDVTPQYVFTCSLSDFFHEDADPWRDEAWEIIRQTPHLTYQILTKRPERIATHLPKTCFNCGCNPDGVPGDYWLDPDEGPWPNVWLGTSVENQIYAEKRIPQLVNVPAVVHFLSCEPLLGPIDFETSKITYTDTKTTIALFGLLSDIEWVIVGGESGPHFREMNPDWASGIKNQCRSAGVPFFYKQGSARFPEADTMLDGREWHEMPR